MRDPNSDGLRVVCRVEIPGIERDGGREIGLSANHASRLLKAVSDAWPGVTMKGGWPGTVEFAVDTEPVLLAPEPRPPLAERLWSLQKAANATSAEIGDSTGIGMIRVAAFADGYAEPTGDELVALAKFYGVTVEALAAP